MLGNILTDYLIDFNYQIHMIWRGVCVCVCVCVYVCGMCVWQAYQWVFYFKINCITNRTLYTSTVAKNMASKYFSP